MNQEQKGQASKNEQATQGREAKQSDRKKLLLMAGAVVIVILAFIVGSFTRNDDKKIVGEQPLQWGQKKQEEAKVQQKTEEAINDYLTAIRNKDYEKAANYISDNAKSMDGKLKENPAEWGYREFKSEPLVRAR
ncbi:hypothetical protein [Paenibacillus tuaregi]|uniref:hypothetical protein n=1 Tax=Paenibacillus tuaregi TaxID=1816681 RepID=UPI000837E9F3|nr:hypothetical protein [Paenibacillus tuaregi]